jgi:hypothetical protein
MSPDTRTVVALQSIRPQRHNRENSGVGGNFSTNSAQENCKFNRCDPGTPNPTRQELAAPASIRNLIFCQVIAAQRLRSNSEVAENRYCTFSHIRLSWTVPIACEATQPWALRQFPPQLAGSSEQGAGSAESSALHAQRSLLPAPSRRGPNSSAVGQPSLFDNLNEAAGELTFRRAVEMRRCESVRNTAPAALPPRAEHVLFAPDSRGRKQLVVLGETCRLRKNTAV